MRKLVLLAALLALAAPAAHAACVDKDALVVDTTKIPERHINVERVTAAARQLASDGATVRVRVYDTLHGSSNASVLVDKDIQECGWTQSDGKTRISNLIYVPLAVDKGDVVVATGRAINARMGEPVVNKLVMQQLEPHWQDWNKDKRNDKAITDGLVSLLQAMHVELAQPVAARNGPTTIINQAPSDHSWVWKLPLGLALAIALVIGLLFLLRSKEDSGTAKGAQQRARAACSDCIARVQAISQPRFIADRKFAIDAAEGLPPATQTQLKSDLDKIGAFAASARSTLSRFLPDMNKDLNPNGLSASAYSSNESACTDILAHFVEPAEALAQKIDTALESAHAQPKVA